ncbi:hypothetical protein EV193_1011120 [Herbihabitans rhizosphaerae]|uniref:DUF4352 domain-containing protein n=1 Tax=Herbihabitans rhizosphaerae TaxID=1872711 RepID=A0A4V2EUN9_9PSEU|nr:hypothetical protein [Herbihabitans rhizosphaerae]RZS45233.1 hypothetical protein EV193_1011120 [Herbihabitans rhizosphaerae]
MRTKICLTAALGTAALLAGCGSDSGDSSTPSTPNTQSSSPSAGPSSQGGPVQPGALATPGTKLKFGQKVTIPIEDDEQVGVVSLSVNSIEKGTDADMATVRAGMPAADASELDGRTLYFVKKTITNESGTEVARALSGMDIYSAAYTADDKSSDPVIRFDAQEFARCKANEPKSFKDKGKTIEHCAIVSAPVSTPLIVAKYTDEPYGSRDGQAITWAP